MTSLLEILEVNLRASDVAFPPALIAWYSHESVASSQVLKTVMRCHSVREILFQDVNGLLGRLGAERAVVQCKADGEL